MADVIKLVQGDSRPALAVTLTDENTGAIIDITGSTPRMYFRATGLTTILATLVGSVVSGPAGTCAFAWGAALATVAEGDYEGEIEVTFADTTVQTTYRKLKFRVREDF